MVVLNAVLVRFLETGNSIIVGTRNEQALPHAARAVGLTVASDREHVTVYLPEPSASRALRNVERVPLIALTCSHPPTHRTVQLKGDVLAVRDLREGERSVVERYRERFVEVLAQIGMAPAIVERLHIWPCRAVEVAVTALFDQTPGPGAGGAIDPGSERMSYVAVPKGAPR